MSLARYRSSPRLHFHLSSFIKKQLAIGQDSQPPKEDSFNLMYLSVDYILSWTRRHCVIVPWWLEKISAQETEEEDESRVERMKLYRVSLVL